MQREGSGRDGRHDFDFLVGSWRVQHRCLRERLRGSTAWEEFTGTSVGRTLLNGLGNFDECTMERESGHLYGMTVRLYNPGSQQWSLHWADSVSGVLFAPMIGQFAGERGEFYSQEPFEGRAIFSRFIWSGITESSCCWEQAFSEDGGRSWETNWVMEFTRQ